MPLILDSFRAAVTAHRAVQGRSEDRLFMAAQDDVTREAIRSGVIHHFALTYERAWKFMRRQIAAEIGSLSVQARTVPVRA